MKTTILTHSTIVKTDRIQIDCRSIVALPTLATGVEHTAPISEQTSWETDG